MISKALIYAATAGAALSISGMADARSMRAVGSSTVYPFAKMAAERVARANPRLGTPIIESTGTGAGFKLFCSGVGERFPDVSNASRRMKAKEAQQCASNGVKDVTEIQIGLDGVAIATAKGTPMGGITQRDLYLAIAKTPFGKPNKAKTWKDVNARLPALPIRVYGPPSTSGTRDALGELLMTPPCEANASMAALKKSNEAKFKAICTGIRTDGAYIEAGENDNLIVQKLAANPGTLGIFGYSFLEENVAKVKGVNINGVAPTYQTISTFKYPGARPLYIYVKNAHVRAIPAIRAFVAEITKESAIGPRGYMLAGGLVAAPAPVRARAQLAARNLT
ncbi:MAG: substrate-binding domain-containing protein, partial [Sphingomicrobium sp.]